jgi:hypothetical protein
MNADDLENRNHLQHRESSPSVIGRREPGSSKKPGLIRKTGARLTTANLLVNNRSLRDWEFEISAFIGVHLRLLLDMP